MTRLRKHWLAGLLGLSALVTAGLLIWPTGAAAPPSPPQAKRYAGPDIEARRGGPVLRFALRLGGPAAAPEVVPPPETLPVLVGIAGRRAYLRSTASGEVERVSIGQDIDGWRLVGVSARAATLRGPDGDRRLEMFAAGSGSAPGAPGAVAVGQPAQGG